MAVVAIVVFRTSVAIITRCLVRGIQTAGLVFAILAGVANIIRTRITVEAQVGFRLVHTFIIFFIAVVIGAINCIPAFWRITFHTSGQSITIFDTITEEAIIAQFIKQIVMTHMIDWVTNIQRTRNTIITRGIR